MKKNVLGHMQAQKEPAVSRISRWKLLQRAVCLLLALIIWLAVYAITDRKEAPAENGTSVEDGV